jgi:hypothetical protein
MTRFKPIQSLSRCDDFDTLHFINGQHTWLISGNDQVGLAGNGGCENDYSYVPIRPSSIRSAAIRSNGDWSPSRKSSPGCWSAP